MIVINFTVKIDEAIIDRIAGAETRLRKPGVYWPSEASIVVTDKLGGPQVVGKCMRAAYYAHKNTPVSNRVTPQSARKMETGKVIENQEHVYAAEAGILLETDKALHKKYGEIELSAKLDAIYKDDVGEPVIIEIKSYYGYYARKELAGNTRQCGRPKVTNVLQLMLYLDLYPEAKYGKLRYIDRSDMTIVEHRVELKPYRVSMSDGQFSNTTIASINGDADAGLALAKIIQRYTDLHSKLAKNELPERDYILRYSTEQANYKERIGEFTKANKERMKKNLIVSDWQCTYCAFRNQCVRDE